MSDEHPVLRPVLNSAETLRHHVMKKVVNTVESVFPIEMKTKTLTLTDVQPLHKEFSPEEQKHALMTGGSLAIPVKGTLTLKDLDGKVLDQAKNFTLMHVPYFTERHTLILDGNEYQVANMLRRKPGVYTQRSANGELTTLFNLSKGKNFYVGMNPEKGTFHLEYGTSKIPLYPVLRALGVPHTDFAKYVGSGVADQNKAVHGHHLESATDKLYKKIVHPALIKPTATHDEKVKAIEGKFDQTAMDGSVSKVTLGTAHNKVTPLALLEATKRLLHTHEGKQDIDDSDSLGFKTFHSVDDFFAERMKLFSRTWLPKAKMRFQGRDKIREAITPQPFTDTLKRFVTTSTLAAVPTGINPIELLDHAVKVTTLGEGGIPNERAVPYETRMLHPTQYGVIDLVRTPESSHAGVDLRATVAAHRDETGHLYTPVYDVKKKIDTYLQAGDINQRVIAFPHQKLEGTVDAFVKGKVTRVPIEDVQYQFKHYAQTLSPATSLIPFLHSTQGNRSIMGAKMQTQSLPLVEREAPYVQVKSHSSDKSYEHLYGHTILPTAPIDGTVEKIEGGWIHIRPHGSVKKADEYIEHFASPIALPSGWSAIARNHSADKGGVILRRAHPTTGQTMVDKMSHEEFEAHKNGAPWVSTNWDTAGNLKTAEDRPTIERKPLGPFTFNIEIKKGAGHKAEGQTKAKGSSEDYGHLPGYTGPDGDSLDFFVGNDHDGHLFAYDKQKRPDAKSPWKTTDVKFVVGLNKADHDEFVRRTTDWNSATVRFANKRNFRDWDHLKEHIDEHYKDEHKLAADEDEGLVRVPYQDNFPFPSKTYLHHTLDVKPGDKVTKGQRLADSNFTRDGVLALGKNLRVAYMAWHGLNSNDAVVISESCAKKLISEHVYREVYPITHKIELNKNKHHIYYGAQYTPQQYAALDEHGIVKVGAKVSHHDLLVAGLSKAEISGTDLMLGRISKALTKPYREVALHWEHGTQGVVSEVVRTANQIAILVKTQEPMQVGDKLAGRYGNKGVVAEIVPDSQMVRDEGGNVIDVIMTSAGVVSRINPGQIIETAVGKVAHKTGKPIVYNNAAGHDTVQWAKDLLKEHGIKDKETVYDPTRKRYIKGGDGKGVFVGHQFIFKLFKSTETNFSAHGVGPYDINEQPSKKGGEESPKGLAKMEFDALVAHDVRNILNEVSTIRSQKNEEFWKALQLGQPLPVAKPAFVFNKFTALLEGAGVKMHKEGSKIKLLPKTDKDILAMSSGAILNNKTVSAKNMQPENGGLFDPLMTGGAQGTKYSHIPLFEPMPNPVFEEPIRRLLGLTQSAFQEKLKTGGGTFFKKELAKIDVPARITKLREEMKKASGATLNDMVKQVKALQALQSQGLAPQDAYVISHTPVVPPMFRPILPMPNDPKQLMVADANKLYAHLIDANTVLKSTVLESDRPKHREHLYNAVGALFGTHEVADDELRGQKVKGFLTAISGQGSPKGGFFQRKIMRRTQDVSGRGTAVPDVNLNMDQVGLPEDMLWQMYDRFIIARLIRNGYPALLARDMVTKRHPAARDSMLQECKERPVYINRAPTLHRYSIVSAFPQPVQGKTIRVNPFIEQGMNLDYDGDALQVHAPVTAGGVTDSHKMLLSNQLMSDQTRDKLIAYPQHEAILGVIFASQSEASKSKKSHTFDTHQDLLTAWRKGDVGLNDKVTLTSPMTKKAEFEEAPEYIHEDLGDFPYHWMVLGPQDE